MSPGPEVLERIQRRIERLAELSEPGAGVTRLAYTSLERDAHELVIGWGLEDGAAAEIDAAGNTVLIYAPGEPYLLVGSHLDSVPNGGRYDGVAGVVVALEVAAALGDSLGVGLRVVVFAAEEGARFGKPNLGSALAVGGGDPEAIVMLRDANGVRVADAAAEVGLNPVACEPWLAAPEVAAFVEVHIEQGRVLESSGARIGVVDAVAGSVRTRFEITGRAEHTGTTPMALRHDALAAASELVLAAESIAQASREGVATIGKLEVHPNAITTIPGRVSCVADVRDVDPDLQRRAAESLQERFAEICERRRLAHSATVLSAHDPVMLSAWPRLALLDACAETGLPYRIMPSGAGHDAAVAARRAPAAMLFVPCDNGLSHVPEESAAVDDLALAATIVVEALGKLAGTVCAQ